MININEVTFGIRTHSFRATIITDLLESTPIDEVKALMGHKNISTTLD